MIRYCACDGSVDGHDDCDYDDDGRDDGANV